MTQSEVHYAETYLVNQVARIADVTVRTLHYYEEIGLLVPAARSEAGYRLYDASNLDRLRQIRVGRELGLSLEEIRRSLDEAGFDRRSTLLRQRRQLVETATTTAATIEAIDRALTFLENGQKAERTGPTRTADGPDRAGAARCASGIVREPAAASRRRPRQSAARASRYPHHDGADAVRRYHALFVGCFGYDDLDGRPPRPASAVDAPRLSLMPSVSAAIRDSSPRSGL